MRRRRAARHRPTAQNAAPLRACANPPSARGIRDARPAGVADRCARGPDRVARVLTERADRLGIHERLPGKPITRVAPHVGIAHDRRDRLPGAVFLNDMRPGPLLSKRPRPEGEVRIPCKLPHDHLTATRDRTRSGLPDPRYIIPRCKTVSPHPTLTRKMSTVCASRRGAPEVCAPPPVPSCPRDKDGSAGRGRGAAG
jgi:hypothetical protein